MDQEYSDFIADFAIKYGFMPIPVVNPSVRFEPISKEILDHLKKTVDQRKKDTIVVAKNLPTEPILGR